MPYHVDHPRKLRIFLSQLRERIYQPIGDLQVTAWVTSEPVPFEARITGERIGLKSGDQWGDLWDCAWFHFEGSVPEAGRGKRVVLLIDVNGELCLMDETGSPKQGLTNVNSEFDKSLGLPGKRVVHVADSANGGEIIDIWADAGCNDLFGKYRGGTLREARIAICNDNLRALYYDFEVLTGLMESLPEDSARGRRVAQSLHDAMNLLSCVTDDSVRQARSRLSVELGRTGGDATLTISAIGHAHIDLAWLWPIRETIRKGARTFSTALRMMEQYPDYVFGASQPQLYQWMKESYPKLYGEVKRRIEEGRWEVQGAMWVEPDSNLAGGEALVRQILYGKRYFQQEFGKDVKSLWVPDIFGYSAALPQMLKKSGVNFMMTQKLSWNTHNTHPHHTFWWEGIDGSRVLTHMPPEATYNGPATPQSITKLEQSYIDKNVSDHALMLFGIGDGGGGPGAEHLERLKREKNLQGLSPVVQEHSAAFFDKLAKQSDCFQTWRGELYLERHQGTLTTQGRNKRYNRKLERALREVEFAAQLHVVLLGYRCKTDDLEAIWKEVLLYQFHDILPGSSITRVYTESLERYEVLLNQVEQMIADIYGSIAANVNIDGIRRPRVVFNSLPWERTEWICLDERWLQVTVPAMGYRVVDASEAAALECANLSACERRVENAYLRVEFADDGHIVSAFDKEHNREIVAKGERANRLSMYHDHGDGWDFPENYAELEAEPLQLEEVVAKSIGPRAALTHVYRYGDSQIKQTIVLTEGSRRLDFHTEVDWQESNKMLRSAFPVNIHTEHVNCEIQFGYVKRNTHRNTSWDAAKDEICAHQWIDLSEPNYGVALLNDCKYGHRAERNVLDISLLRSPGYPDPAADRGKHEFTYSLLPHHGDFVDANVYRAGYELNVNLRAFDVPDATAVGDAHLPSCYSLVELSCPYVMIETVKQAEDDDALIVRFYETAGAHQDANVKLNVAVDAAEVTDLMEASLGEKLSVDAVSGEIALQFTPFEIKTVKFVRK